MGEQEGFLVVTTRTDDDRVVLLYSQTPMATWQAWQAWPLHLRNTAYRSERRQKHKP